MTLDLTQSLPSHVRATSGRPVEDSTLMEVWQGLSAAIVDQIADNWAATTERYAKGRQEHYFSAEFLMGRALLNNLSNLGLVEKAREALAAYGLDLGQVLEENRMLPSVTVASVASPPASWTPAPPWTCPCAATASSTVTACSSSSSTMASRPSTRTRGWRRATPSSSATRRPSAWCTTGT